MPPRGILYSAPPAWRASCQHRPVPGVTQHRPLNLAEIPVRLNRRVLPCSQTPLVSRVPLHGSRKPCSSHCRVQPRPLRQACPISRINTPLCQMSHGQFPNTCVRFLTYALRRYLRHGAVPRTPSLLEPIAEATSFCETDTELAAPAGSPQNSIASNLRRDGLDLVSETRVVHAKRAPNEFGALGEFPK